MYDFVSEGGIRRPSTHGVPLFASVLAEKGVSLYNVHLLLVIDGPWPLKYAVVSAFKLVEIH